MLMDFDLQIRTNSVASNSTVMPTNGSLKSLKKKVKQMEAQREKVREWAHKAELLDAKKMKLKYKEILQELDRDET